MSDYGIKVGYYIFPNNDNDNGLIIYIPRLTKKYIYVEFYNYYDNNIWLDPNESHTFGTLDTIRFRRKMESNDICKYKYAGAKYYTLDDDHYQENL